MLMPPDLQLREYAFRIGELSTQAGDMQGSHSFKRSAQLGCDLHSILLRGDECGTRVRLDALAETAHVGVCIAMVVWEAHCVNDTDATGAQHLNISVRSGDFRIREQFR